MNLPLNLTPPRTFKGKGRTYAELFEFQGVSFAMHLTVDIGKPKANAEGVVFIHEVHLRFSVFGPSGASVSLNAKSRGKQDFIDSKTQTPIDGHLLTPIMMPLLQGMPNAGAAHTRLMEPEVQTALADALTFYFQPMDIDMTEERINKFFEIAASQVECLDPEGIKVLEPAPVQHQVEDTFTL